MAGLISNLLLLAIQYVILDCTRRTLRSVYKPYGPMMCRQLCQDFTDTFYFIQEDLSCHRFSTNNSADTAKDSLKNCLREGKRMNDRNAFTLRKELDVCSNHYEVSDAYEPKLAIFTTESARGPDTYLGHVSYNISLHQACEEGRLCVVEFILSKRPTDINSRDKLGRTPVMAAALKRQVTVFDFLVSQNCDLMAVDNNKDTVLHVACDGGSVDIVRQLVVNHTYDIERRGGMGRTPVMRSALHGHRDVFDLLISKGCNVTNIDSNMNNILHVACSGGHVDMVKYVLAKLLFDIESRGEKGRTPVLIAAHSGHTEVFCFFASNVSNLSAVDDNKDNILHVACIGGHVQMVQLILSKTPIDIESKAQHGRTPVMRAAQYGQMSVVKFLVNRGANLTVVDDYMNTVLHLACYGGHVSIVKYILPQHKISKDVRGQYGRTPVMSAAEYGHKRVIKYLMINGCKLTVVDNKGNNILHVACIGGNVDMVKYIFSQTKIGIESRGQYGRTPVMIAASLGHVAVVKYLEREGCKLSIQDHQGNNILHVACMSGNVDIVKYIFSQTKIGTESRGQYGRTPVMMAASFGHVAVVKYLERESCKLSIQDHQGNNILHVACMSGNLDMVKYVFSQTKIGVESRGQYGRTPVIHATNLGHIAVVKYLVSKGCKLSIQHSEGNNILHVACIGGNVDMVKYIFSQTNIGIESRGQYGRTPVMMAASLGHVAVVKYLEREGCKLSIQDHQGNNILHAACMSSNVDMVKYIFSQTKIGTESRGQYGRTPVMIAASLGHVTVVKYLEREGCKLSTQDHQGNNILHVACMSGNVDMVKYVFSQTKIGVESRGQYGRTPVIHATNLGHVAVVKYLVSIGCKLSIQHSGGNNILHTACMSGNVNMVKYIFSQTNIGIESRGQYGRTPVMMAASLGHVAVVKYLEREGCKLSIQDLQGNNILHEACIGGNVDMVKYVFLKTKIGIESRGQYGRTPVMIAANLGHVAVVKYLEREGCKLSIQDHKGNNILHTACMSGNVDMVKYIFSQTNFGIESRGQYGRTPVMYAANFGQMAVVKYLVDKGCKLSMQDSQGSTILHIACMSGDVNLVKYVFSQTKIGIESRTKLGWTPLMAAGYFGHVSLFKYLVSKGCKLTATDVQGNNVLHVVCMRGHADLVKYILSIRKIAIDSIGQYHRTPVMAAVSNGC